MAVKSVDVVYHFRDNNGRKAQTRVHADAATALAAGGVGFGASVASALESLSSAALVSYEEVYSYVIEPAAGKPAATSDCYRRLLLFFRNESSGGTFALPSPADTLPFDADGPYRAARLTREAVVLSGVLDSLQGLLASTVLADGSTFPDAFSVGSVTRNEV